MSSPIQRYQRDPSIVSRDIAGETILVPIRKNAGDLESIYTLNETAARAWGLIDGQHTLGDIHAQLIDEYEVAPDQAWQDLEELVDSLAEIGALVEV